MIIDLPEGFYKAGFAFAELSNVGKRQLAWFDALIPFRLTIPRPQAPIGYCNMPVNVACWQVSDSVISLIKDFSGSITVLPHTVDFTPNEVFFLPCLLKNDSSELWRGTLSKPFLLSYHWHDALGELVTFDGERTNLPSGCLASGREVKVKLKVIAPTALGSYRLTVTPLLEGVFWFDQCGFTSAVLEINVV